MNGIDNLRSALHPKILELIIFPTERCNFRCTYCYETFENGKMKRPIIEGIKKLIDARVARNSVEHLALSWFGGEPTLALDVMLELSEHAKTHERSGAIKSVTGFTTTNGYTLNGPNLKKLTDLGQTGFQISLDGYGEGHDETRRYASGKGTFGVIWKNLMSAHATDYDFSIVLRLHQTAENGASMDRLVDEIHQKLAGDMRFSIFFKTIENLGGPNASQLEKMRKAEAEQRVARYTRQLRDAGFSVTAVLDGPESSKGEQDEIIPTTASGAAPSPQVLTGDPRKDGFGGYICYASKPNSLVIRSTGRIGKCTVMLEDDRNDIGYLNSDGTVKIDNDKLRVWMRGFESFDPMELGCPAQNIPKSESPVEFIKRPAKVTLATVAA